MMRHWIARSLVGLVILHVAPVGAAHSDEATPAKIRPVVAQGPIGDNACGPCALYNALVWGSEDLQALAQRLPGKGAVERIEGVIAKYGSKPSEEYAGKRPRYTESDGITWVDLLNLTNDLLRAHDLAAVEGSYLDRQQKETPADCLRRVHKILRTSLDAGLPPIVSVRSFAALSNGKEQLWEGLHGHWITLVEVPAALAEREKGFRFGFLDPESGKLEYGYAYAEEVRNFAAAKGNREKWVWLSNRPFLLVTAPALRLRTQDQPWHARTNIILNYAIYRTKAPERGETR
jgi:hypothetical protein